MALEISAESVICPRCGKKYSKRRTLFHTCYQAMYKGIGYLTICSKCVDELYAQYLAKSMNEREAVKKMCRKLDLYWSDSIFDYAVARSTSRSVISAYISRVNSGNYVGKCYDDSIEEGTVPDVVFSDSNGGSDRSNDLKGIPKKVIQFWGNGFSADMYRELEQRRQYWVSRLPNNGKDMDIGTEALIRQICSLELDINRDRIAGRPVEKSVTALNTLLGSANLKPVQQKNDADADAENTPFGVWIQRFEKEKPVPDVDPDLKDVDGIAKYISTWFYGHLGKSLGVKNIHSKLYDEEIKKLSVEHPEYSDDEDDDELLYDVLGDKNEDDKDESDSS